ncbi:MAG: matrixin family metalloprotease [Nostoc sp. CmiVER01]|uniref:matrixin family metalloprotease n=1 Tax=Nostoc sp. CmiVER01 TaxID=3075384 RepID=UPI002AD5101C|nr:matrixin family metalloprotease [Nostoc sp. CmiVER01]MDZ8123237.1 matrixin family metalloprotease [Nostoc sp. CmiVER01]
MLSAFTRNDALLGILPETPVESVVSQGVSTTDLVPTSPNIKPAQDYNFSQSDLLVKPVTGEEQSLGTSQAHADGIDTENTLLEPDTFLNGDSKWSQPSGKGTPITITYSYSNLLDGNLLGGLAVSTLTSAIEEALRLWATYAPLNFVEIADSGPAPSNNYYPAANHPQIRFGYSTIDGSSGDALAEAYHPSTTDGLGGDIHFDSSETWAIKPGSNQQDILETAVHEIGHALGLRHELVNSAVMNPVDVSRYSGLGSAFLLDDDIKEIRDIYGTGVGSVVPLPASRIDGTANNDNIIGTPGADINYALPGNDSVSGGDGNHQLFGGKGIHLVHTPLEPENFKKFGSKWPQPSGKGTQVVITYSYSNLLDGNLLGGLAVSTLTSAIQEALKLWATYAPLNFVETSDSRSSQIRFGYRTIDGAGGNATAETVLVIKPILDKTDIYFDISETWAIKPGSNQYDILETAVHEIGHALGLDHEPSPQDGGTNAIMNPSSFPRYSGLGSAFLLDDDIKGIQDIYGTGVGSLVPLASRRIDGTANNDNIIGNPGADINYVLPDSDSVSGGDGNHQLFGGKGIDLVHTPLEPESFKKFDKNFDFKWPPLSDKDTRVVIYYSYSNLLDGNLPGGLAVSTLTLAIEEALRLWATYAPLNFVEVSDSSSSQIRFGYQNIDGAGKAAGETELLNVVHKGGVPEPASDINIYFSSSYSWGIKFGSNQQDILQIAVHEIGHALGLDHEPSPKDGGTNAIMNPRGPSLYSGLGSAFLYDDDIKGIRDIYGTGVGLVQPLPRIYGTPKNDTLIGTPRDEIIYAFAGNDKLSGLGGNDTLIGSDGNDTLIGGAGNDSLDGGLGEDTGDYSNATQGINITLGASGFATNDGFGTQDKLTGIDHIIGSRYNDTIVGDAGWNNTLRGGAGNDNLSGLGGNDTLIGGDGNDTLNGGAGSDNLDGGLGEDTGDYSNATQGINVTLGGSGFATNDGFGTRDKLTGIDHIIGSQYNDTIVGDAGWNNTLRGGAGNDDLSGLGGNDTLTGGAGADRFLFDSVSEGIDTITDFSHSSRDKIFIRSTFGATSTSQFSYNNTTGALSFNSTQFATLNTNSGFITAQDIIFA